MFLLRRPVPWRQDAADRVVEALQDRTARSYMVLNMPPGSGKSTLFTHDIPAWLICGGGLCDPLRGRATRVMLGSFGFRSAVHYVMRIRRLLESPRPFLRQVEPAPSGALARAEVWQVQAPAGRRLVEGRRVHRRAARSGRPHREGTDDPGRVSRVGLPRRTSSSLCGMTSSTSATFAPST